MTDRATSHNIYDRCKSISADAFTMAREVEVGAHATALRRTLESMEAKLADVRNTLTENGLIGSSDEPLGDTN